MIRLVYLLRRKSDMTLETFQQYWREQHGPLVAGYANDLNILRYIQVHALDDPANDAMANARGGMEPRYDGVAELWFKDSAALGNTLQSSSGQAAAQMLLEDEQKFIDLPNSPLWLNHEYPQVNPTPENLLAHPKSNLVKLYFPLRFQAGRDEAEVRRYWLTNHGPLIRSHAPAMSIQRYMQVHRFNDPLEAALREARGTIVPPYDGHAEVWFDRRENATATPEAQAGGRAAIEDEALFIDFARSTMWLGKEHVLIDRI